MCKCKIFKAILVCIFSSSVLSLLTSSEDTPTPQNRTFSIDFENNCFLKDGRPFEYISGSVHYFRMLESKWDDILYKMKIGGLNAVQMYVEWASHQSTPDEYNFSGNLNLFKFLDLAKQNDLLVILRPGPYIDAERDMGGLPSWLLWKYPNINLRSTDIDFTREVSKWFGILLHMLKPYLYIYGGPIIMIQVENEYGSYSCDMDYKMYLRDLIKSIVGPTVVLFTTDFAEEDKLRCGSVPGVYPTVDFGTETNEMIRTHFTAQRVVAPKGPLVNSEFYSGWFDRWGYPHRVVKTDDVVSTLDMMLEMGANVNIYMYHGGTSFGFHSGSTTDNVTGPGGFQSCITSYDFDAPLNEAGDPTEKYFEIKRIIEKYRNVSTENPVIGPKGNYGKIELSPLVSILDESIMTMFATNPVDSLLPLQFEQLSVASGFVLYETIIQFSVPDPVLLSVTHLRDRAYVYIEKELVGVLSRSENISSLPIFIDKEEKLQILVESQGRPSFGEFLGESKGIGPEVWLGSHMLQNWRIYPIGELEIKNFQKFSQLRNTNNIYIPKIKSWKEFGVPRKSAMIFTATFTIGNKTNPNALDTFVRFDGWRKGIFWINNFNLGRYWPVVGPQQTLYLPSSLVNPYPGKNYLMILELERIPKTCSKSFKSGSGCFVELTDKHVINGTTPY